VSSALEMLTSKDEIPLLAIDTDSAAPGKQIELCCISPTTMTNNRIKLLLYRYQKLRVTAAK